MKSYNDGELRITTNTHFCSDYFTLSSLTNFHGRKTEFTDNLLLAQGAELTVSLPSLHPRILPTSGTIIGIRCSPISKFQ